MTTNRIIIKKIINPTTKQKIYQVVRYQNNIDKGVILETPSAQDALAFLAGFCSHSSTGLGVLVGTGEWS